MKAKIRVCTIIFLGIFLGSWHTNAQEPISVNTVTNKNDSLASINKEPGIDDSVEVDTPPAMDMDRFASLLEYPEDARLAEVEGQVVLRTLVKKDGSLKKIIVENSDNVILNESAINALKKYGYFAPALLNGKPIDFWVSIPIQYKLTDYDGSIHNNKSKKSGKKSPRTLWDVIFGD